MTTAFWTAVCVLCLLTEEVEYRIAVRKFNKEMRNARNIQTP